MCFVEFVCFLVMLILLFAEMGNEYASFIVTGCTEESEMVYQK